MLHTKYQSSTPSSVREEDFQIFPFFFFLFVAMATRVMGGIKFFGQFWYSYTQETFLPSFMKIGPVVLEKMFKEIVDGRRTLGDHNSSPSALCAKVS